jgi:hypothetical protein
LFNLTGIIWRLQQSNKKAYYLAVLRVATCLWILKELLLRWPAFEVLYSNHSFLKVPPGGIYFLHKYLYQLKENYMVIIYGCIVLLLLNILGIGRNLVSFLLFLTLAVLLTMNDKFKNGGELMALLLTFYLSFANTFSYFTLIKRKPFGERNEKLYNLLSNLAAYSIMLNLSFIYFMAAVGKLEDPLWRNGTALHYYMNNLRGFVFAGSGQHFELPAIILYILNYAVILLELTAPVLIWYKAYRLPVFALLFLMHLVIYCFFMLYGMSVIFVIQYGLFFSEEEIKKALQKIKGLFRKRTPGLEEGSL